MKQKKKQRLSFGAIASYITAGVMAILFIMSIVGIFISEDSSMRAFFIMAALITLVLILTSLLIASWSREKKKEAKPAFASYAFEGEFAPQKKTVSQKSEKSKTKS